jgi:hypothetical protein
MPSNHYIPVGAVAQFVANERWIWRQWDGATWVPCPGVEVVLKLSNGAEVTVPRG